MVKKHATGAYSPKNAAYALGEYCPKLLKKIGLIKAHCLWHQLAISTSE